MILLNLNYYIYKKNSETDFYIPGYVVLYTDVRAGLCHQFETLGY
jgi:hypothetical protein